MLRKADQKNWY